MPLNQAEIGRQIVAQAASIAGGTWGQIKEAATVELRGLAQRIVLIARAFAQGEITKSIAQRHLRLARFHVIATIAMLTMLLEAAVERIVNGALTVVRDAINQAVGFALIV